VPQSSSNVDLASALLSADHFGRPQGKGKPRGFSSTLVTAALRAAYIHAGRRFWDCPDSPGRTRFAPGR